MAMKRDLIVLAPVRPPSGDLAQRVAALLAKADRRPFAAEDDRSLYGDLFVLAPEGWPVAALTRSVDAGDAGEHAWLRADPACFRAETGSVRLLACGDVGQGRREAEALAASLAPLFGDEGYELSAPHPHRWYLRPFAHNATAGLPVLPSPERAVGGDLFELWPEDDLHRRWRRIFSEAQILLAQHPVGHARARSSRPAINGLWFWGAGQLPDQVRADALAAVVSDDPLLRGLATAAGIALAPSWQDDTKASGTLLLDLRSGGDAQAHLEGMLSQWRSGHMASLQWRAPQSIWTLKRRHRWRFWR